MQPCCFSIDDAALVSNGTKQDALITDVLSLFPHPLRFLNSSNIESECSCFARFFVISVLTKESDRNGGGELSASLSCLVLSVSVSPFRCVGGGVTAQSANEYYNAFPLSPSLALLV